MVEALRVLLGETAATIYDIRLPAYISYKIDGWRGTWRGLEFLTRNGKAIKSRTLQAYAKQYMMNLDGWDGEICVGPPNAEDVFRRTDAFCKAYHRPLPADGVKFYVFDNSLCSAPYHARYEHGIWDVFPFVVKLDQHLIEKYDDLAEFEEQAVIMGYEGIVARTPLGRYKNGRSTLNEQLLIKLKRWRDSEGIITGFEEKMHNANPAEKSETGYTHRSSHKEGKIPAGTLGKFVVDWHGHELRVGTGLGLTDEVRLEIWRNQSKYLGKALTFKYFPVGMKELPRQPIAKWFRSDK